MASAQRNQTPWWGADVSEIYVDIADISEEDKERLGLPTCCEATKASVTSTQTSHVYTIAAWVLVALGVFICVCSVYRIIWEGVLNVPETPPFVPALSEATNSRSVVVRRVMLIYNPNAGKGEAEEMATGRIVPALRARGVECEAVPTDRCGHARELAAQCDLARFDALVCMGGDGTFHELVNGLMSRSDGQRVPLALIPFGSGNGRAATHRQNMRRHGKEMTIYEDLDAVMEWCVNSIAAGRVARVDLMEVETGGRRLAGVTQLLMGMFGEVDILAEPYRCLGPARLDALAVWCVVKKQASNYQFSMKRPDGSTVERSVPAVGLMVGLTQHWTGDMRAVPTAQLDDGVAELCYIDPEGASVDGLLAAFLQLPTGAHVHNDEIWKSQQVTAVNFTFDGPGIFNLDGEIMEHDGQLQLRVLPRHLDMLLGPEEFAWAAPASQSMGDSFGSGDLELVPLAKNV